MRIFFTYKQLQNNPDKLLYLDGHINPATGVWDDNYWATHGGAASNNSSSGGGNVDVVGNAQKLLDFQKTANAPIVTQLQTQQPGLNDKYTQLVNSIKGNQQLDTNRQTTTTNNLLAQRGITSNSNLGQQEMTNALTPIDTQYAGLTANANAGSIADTQALALQIANLQAGNPDTAIPNALNYGNVVNSANSIANQYALGQQQIAQQNPLIAAQTAYAQAQAGYLNGQNVGALQKFAQLYGGQ